MSIYYNIKERLIINDTEKHAEAVDIAKYQLSLLGAWILQDRAGVISLTVVTNGEKHQFKGEVMTEAYHDLIRGFENASSLEVEANYYYVVSASESVAPGPFVMADHLETLFEEDPDMQEGIFYSMYNNADCADGVGILCAYGQKDGKSYCGTVEPTDAELPETGVWVTQDTSMVFDETLTEDMDIEQIRSCVTDLASLGTDADVQFDEDSQGVALFLNYLCLDAKNDFAKYIDICQKLIVATNGKVGIMAEFVCDDQPDAQTLLINFNDDGTFKVKKAAV